MDIFWFYFDLTRLNNLKPEQTEGMYYVFSSFQNLTLLFRHYGGITAKIVKRFWMIVRYESQLRFETAKISADPVLMWKIESRICKMFLDVNNVF